MRLLENGANFESREVITGILLQGVETCGVVNKQLYTEEVSRSFIYVAMSLFVLAYILCADGGQNNRRRGVATISFPYGMEWGSAWVLDLGSASQNVKVCACQWH